SSAGASVTSRASASARCPAAVSSDTHAAAWSARAAATIVAPWPASRVAIARPIPRDAPVTSATLPVRSNMRERFNGCEIVGCAEVDHPGFAVNLAYQTAQHRAWTYFNIRCDALRRKAGDDLLPADRRRDLVHERLDRGVRVVLRLAVDVGDDRDP